MTKTTVETDVLAKNEEKQVVKKDKKQKKQKNNANVQPKKSKIKEVFGELKKVTWPTFGKTMKQTGMVLSVVVLFGLVVLGIDLLVGWIITLLSSF